MKSKSKIIKAICILSAAALMTGAFSACGNKTAEGGSSVTDVSSDKGSQASESADKLVKVSYKCDEIKFSDELKDADFDSFKVTENGIFLIYTEYHYDEETQKDSSNTYLCSVDNEGKLISKTDITPEKVNDGDWAYIQNVNYLDDGSVLFFESHYYPVSAPSDDTSPADSEAEPAADESFPADGFNINEESPETENKYYLVHMSADGTVIDKTDTADISALDGIVGSQSNSINGICVNNKGEIAVSYLIYDENWNSKAGIIVLDKDYKQLFKQELSDGNCWINGSFSDGDGNFNYVVYSYAFDGSGENSQKLYRPDYQTGEFAEVFDWKNGSSGTMIGGSGDYLAYYFDYNTVTVEGLKSDGSSETVLNLLNNGLFLDSAGSMCVVGDDFYISGFSHSGTVLYRLRKLDESEMKEKTEVSLAAYYAPYELSSAVAEYNKSDGNYIITINDYSRYNDYSSDDEEAWNSGMTRLNSEISSGQIPDILSISDPEMLSGLSSKGLFLDLNTFIDGEDGLNREDYFDNIFRAMETDGKLYSITSSIGIMGTCAKKSLIPEDGPLTWEQTDAVLSQNSGMRLLSSDTPRDVFLMMILATGNKNFINSSTGECSFNTPEFAEIIERAKEYPQEIDYEALNSDPDYWNNYQMQYRRNETLLNQFYLYSFDSYYQTADGTMGEDISILGMPGSGSGACIFPSSYISVSSKSAHPEAGWELIKSMLEYDEERFVDADYYRFNYFPLNKKTFRQMGEAAIEASYYIDENGNKVQNEQSYYLNDTESVTLRNVDQALIDRTESFISSTDNVYMGMESGITDIINEETAAFYAGTATAQQTADNIQSRVTLYLSEHM